MKKEVGEEGTRLAGRKAELVEAKPYATDPGRLCFLCDSSAGCSHPQLRCARCDKVGLAENMNGRVERHECQGPLDE